MWSVTLALDALHAGLVMDGHPTGGATVVTEEEELVWRATATFQDLPGGIGDGEGARIDFH